jgi:hypothetical protein
VPDELEAAEEGWLLVDGGLELVPGLLVKIDVTLEPFEKTKLLPELLCIVPSRSGPASPPVEVALEPHAQAPPTRASAPPMIAQRS